MSEELPTTQGSAESGIAKPLSGVVSDDAGLAWVMVDASPDALVMVDEAGLIELVNRQTEELFGYDRGELLGRPVETLLPTDLEGVHRAHRTRYRATPDVRAMGSGLDLSGRRRDGTEFPVEISLSPLRQDGELRVIAAVRDISERVEAEQAGRQIRRGIDSIFDGVYMFDPDTMEFVYVNEGGAVQTGYAAEELVSGMGPLMFAPDFTTSEFAELLQPLVDMMVPSIRFETTLRPRSGQDFSVEVVMELPEVDAGAQRVMVCVVRDITERRAAEDAAEIIQHSIDAVSDAVFVCDENTLEFLHVNQGAVDLHGYTREELLTGMTPAVLAPDLPSEKIAAVLAQLASAPEQSSLIVTSGVTKTGDVVPVEVSINWPLPTRDSSPRPVMAVVRDISARVEIENRLRATEARFRTAFADGPVAMAIQSAVNRTILDVNQALIDWLGYSRDELIGRSGAELFHPDDRSPDDSLAVAIASAAEPDFVRTARLVTVDGDTVWARSHISPSETDDGEQTLITHLVDVTAEIEAERARLQREVLVQALSEVRLAMLQGAPRNLGLTMICEAARTSLEAEVALILTPTGAGDELGIEASTPMADSIKERMSFRSTQGSVGRVFDTGKPHFTDNPGLSEDTPEPNRQVLTRHVGSLLMAPLPGDRGVAGVLVVVRPHEAASYTEDHLAPLTEFAGAAASAIGLSQARDLRNTLELLEDRERIGRDMHDIVIGRLFATGMAIQSATTRINDPAVGERLTAAVGEIDEAIKDIREAIYGIRSRPDWGKGARGDILAIVADHNQVLGFEPTVELDGPINELPPPLVVDLIATIREALTNAVRHARASAVKIAVATSSSAVELTVVDNGLGFTDPPKTTTKQQAGNGLRNMTARAEALGGTAKVTSQPGQGTTISWTVPLPWPRQPDTGIQS